MYIFVFHEREWREGTEGGREEERERGRRMANYI